MYWDVFPLVSITMSITQTSLETLAMTRVRGGAVTVRGPLLLSALRSGQLRAGLHGYRRQRSGHNGGSSGPCVIGPCPRGRTRDVWRVLLSDLP